MLFSADEVRGKHVFVIGDVHGCYNEMLRLLHHAHILRPGGVPRLRDNMIVIFVGDLINIGPNSTAMIHFVQNTPGVYSIRGNHEDGWLMKNKEWSYTPHGATNDDIAFLESLPYIIKIAAVTLTKNRCPARWRKKFEFFLP